MLSDQLRYRVRSAQLGLRGQAGPMPKYGEAIFDGSDYPQTWDAFIGQGEAVAHLRAAITSAKARGARLDHVLLASGLAGVGKTSLAKLVAADMGAGLLEVAGAVSVDEVRPALRGMVDGDILFIDEVHQLVSVAKVKAEWLLHLLQDGGLLTARGFEPMPKVTVLAATTDSQRLPLTILGRFLVRPVLGPYDEHDALLIAEQLAGRMGFGVGLLPIPDKELLTSVATASNHAPRDMRALLAALRDCYLGTDYGFDMGVALSWCGVSPDGLNALAQDYLCVLLVMCEGTAGAKTIAGALGEPGPLGHTENLLVMKGLLTIEPNGRRLTDQGVTRTLALLKGRGLLDEEN